MDALEEKLRQLQALTQALEPDAASRRPRALNRKESHARPRPAARERSPQPVAYTDDPSGSSAWDAYHPSDGSAYPARTPPRAAALRNTTVSASSISASTGGPRPRPASASARQLDAAHAVGCAAAHAAASALNAAARSQAPAVATDDHPHDPAPRPSLRAGTPALSPSASSPRERPLPPPPPLPPLPPAAALREYHAAPTTSSSSVPRPRPASARPRVPMSPPSAAVVAPEASPPSASSPPPPLRRTRSPPPARPPQWEPKYQSNWQALKATLLDPQPATPSPAATAATTSTRAPKPKRPASASAYTNGSCARAGAATPGTHTTTAAQALDYSRRRPQSAATRPTLRARETASAAPSLPGTRPAVAVETFMDVGIETEWEELPDDPRDEAETMHVSEDAPTTLEMKLRRLEGLTHALQERDAHAAAAARAEVARPASSSVAHHRPPLNPRAATAPVVFAHLDEPSATAPPPPLVLMPSQPSTRDVATSWRQDASDSDEPLHMASDAGGEEEEEASVLRGSVVAAAVAPTGSASASVAVFHTPGALALSLEGVPAALCTKQAGTTSGSARASSAASARNLLRHSHSKSVQALRHSATDAPFSRSACSAHVADPSLHRTGQSLAQLSEDVLEAVATKLPFASLRALEATCGTLRRLVVQRQLWRKCCGRAGVVGLHVDRRIPVCDAPAATAATAHPARTESAWYKRLRWVLAQPASMRSLMSEALWASSTDNEEEQLANVLTRRTRGGGGVPFCYWSSGGSGPTTPVTLLFRLCAPLTVVHEVQLRAFRAYFQAGHPVYSARQVRVSVGCRTVGWDADGWSPDPSPAALHAGETEWLWTSRVMDMHQVDTMQRFKLPRPVVCAGGLLRVELLGRAQMQDVDNQWFVAMANARVVGKRLPGFVPVPGDADAEGAVAVRAESAAASAGYLPAHVRRPRRGRRRPVVAPVGGLEVVAVDSDGDSSEEDALPWRTALLQQDDSDDSDDEIWHPLPAVMD